MSELTLDTLLDDGNYLGSERARLENKALLDELERKKKINYLSFWLESPAKTLPISRQSGESHLSQSTLLNPLDQEVRTSRY